MLYEVAFLKTPTPEEFKAGELEELIAFNRIVASNEQTALLQSSLAFADTLRPHPADRVKVLVRPFG